MHIEKDGRLILNVEDWYDAAPPQSGELHWVNGRSAKECARAWCEGANKPQIPEEIVRLLNSHTDLAGWQLDVVTPEHKVNFDNLNKPRHTDIRALGQHALGKLCVHIEAKADEEFDDTVADKLREAANNIANEVNLNTNAVTRIQDLSKSLLFSAVPNVIRLGDLRYQLLTAVAGLLADAKKEEEVNRAVFIVHEFVTNETRDLKHQRNKKDLDDFVARISGGSVTTLAPEILYGPFTVPGRPLFSESAQLYVGKAVRNLRNPAS